eukprot:ANDGO_01068.mRNA.1 hypothetical protein
MGLQNQTVAISDESVRPDGQFSSQLIELDSDALFDAVETVECGGAKHTASQELAEIHCILENSTGSQSYLTSSPTRQPPGRLRSPAKRSLFAAARAVAPASSPETAPSIDHGEPSRIISFMPDEYSRVLRSRGVSRLHPWQSDLLCAAKKYHLHERNLVYSTPTSAGKSLVAETLLVHAVCSESSLGLLVLPFVSICEEKYQSLTVFGRCMDFDAEIYAGSRGSFPPPKGGRLILIATIEMANAILNSLLEDGRLNELSCVVVDELHMIGDGSLRGALLESLLIKLRLYQSSTASFRCQIIGMSATLPNLTEIATWLDADLYQGSFRPVPLEEFVVFPWEKETCAVSLDRKRRFPLDLTVVDPGKRFDSEVLVIASLIKGDFNCLVFCPSKYACEYTAKILKLLCPLDVSDARSLLCSRIEYEIGTKMNEVQRDAILYSGIAFHHSGLTAGERRLVEDGFRKRVLRVLCCTSTLAAGVNLPVRRVIFRGLVIGKDIPLTASKYAQMAGRAGRANLDTKGESFAIVRRKDLAILDDISRIRVLESSERMNSSFLALFHSLNVTASSVSTLPEEVFLPFQRLILDCLSAGLLSSDSEPPSLRKLLDFSLFYQQASRDQQILIISIMNSCVDVLVEKGFLRKPTSGSDVLFDILPLGLAVAKSSFAIEDALFLYQELRKAIRHGLVLENELHLCYLSTPVSSMIDPDWKLFGKILDRLPEEDQRIFEICGGDHALVARFAFQPPSTSMFPSAAGASALRSACAAALKNESEQRTFCCRRFYNALILRDAVNEVGVDELCVRFGTSMGRIEMLMTMAGSFAVQMIRFCGRMEWWALEACLLAYAKRVEFGVKGDVIELCEIRGVGQKRARMLYKNGIRSVEDVAKLSKDQLIRRLGHLVDVDMVLSSARRICEQRSRRARMEAERVAVSLTQIVGDDVSYDPEVA